MKFGESVAITVSGVVLIALGAVLESLADNGHIPKLYGPAFLTVGTVLASTGRSLLHPKEDKDVGSSEDKPEGSGN